ncbi:protein of unknown function [Legionella micdadei]|uniref:Uncharacterized protein n=1 Tax=Legionella micdadei TaxID=451 RepID=A0A098GHT3_LEGMI|nr:protein of unknown function [Legionella micdadei]
MFVLQYDPVLISIIDCASLPSPKTLSMDSKPLFLPEHAICCCELNRYAHVSATGSQ